MTVSEIEDFEDLLDAAESNAVSGWDMDFTADLRNRHDQYGDRMYITDRQLEQLERIAEGKR